jgi:glucose/arabinose dehydrogenase
MIVSVLLLIFIFGTFLLVGYSSAQISSNKSCNCVVFILSDVQDSFLAKQQLSVMDLFLSKKISLSLGIMTDQIGNDSDLINRIDMGFKKGLFELTLQGKELDKNSNLTREEQMVSIYQSNEKLSHLFNARAKLYVPPNGVFTNSTIEAMNQVGLRVISGNKDFMLSNDRILPVVGNSIKVVDYTKVYNIPETVGTDKLGVEWSKRSLEQIRGEISSSIEKYGYAVVRLVPKDFVNISNDDLTETHDAGNIVKLGEIIDKIKSQGISIINFTQLTGINGSSYYEPRIPRPVLLDSNLTLQTVYDGFNFPTKMAFLGPNDILVLEKNDGTVKRIVNGSIKSQLLDLNVSTKGERGLLGIAIYHRGELPPYVYLYYTNAGADGSDISTNENNTNSENVLYRYEFAKDKLQSPKLLLRLPQKPTWAHNGGAMTIGPDNNLYIVIGDQVISETKAQNIVNGTEAKGNGGVLRMSPNGRAVDSGILGDGSPLDLYFAYGIRNSFGIAFDPIGHNLWDTENGENSADEINIVKPGFNSGWKKVQGVSKDVTEDNSSLFENFNGKGKYRHPELTWTFSAGPTGLAFLNSAKMGSEYKSSLFVGDFHNGYLYNFKLTDDRQSLVLTHSNNKNTLNKNETQQFLLGKGFGGIVDVKEGPDGYLYVLSTYAGAANCLILVKHCIPYESPVGGTIYRISTNSSRVD